MSGHKNTTIGVMLLVSGSKIVRIGCMMLKATKSKGVIMSHFSNLHNWSNIILGHGLERFDTINNCLLNPVPEHKRREDALDLVPSSTYELVPEVKQSWKASKKVYW